MFGAVLGLTLVVSAAVLPEGVRTAGAPGAAGTYHLDFTLAPSAVEAGRPVGLSFQAIDPRGKSIRFLEMMHERPLHLLVVSEDLADFDHVHPEQVVGTSYDLTYVFPHGGRYRLFASYTPPGSGTLVEQFAVDVAGPSRRAVPLVVDDHLTKVVDGVKATLQFDGPLHAEADLKLDCSFTDAKTGAPVTDLQLYLGSLAHIVLIHEDLSSFVHLHPLDAGEVYDPFKDPAAHFHDPKEWAKRLVGPSPSAITAITNVPRPGKYKLWLQVRRDDRMITFPFVLDVAGGTEGTRPHPAPIPRDAIRVTVSASGYSPARIDAVRGRPVRLAFVRPDGGNCGGTVRFPTLDREYTLPVGEVVLVEFTPTESGEIDFTCGMGMLKGAVFAK